MAAISKKYQDRIDTILTKIDTLRDGNELNPHSDVATAVDRSKWEEVRNELLSLKTSMTVPDQTEKTSQYILHDVAKSHLEKSGYNLVACYVDLEKNTLVKKKPFLSLSNHLHLSSNCTLQEFYECGESSGLKDFLQSAANGKKQVLSLPSKSLNGEKLSFTLTSVPDYSLDDRLVGFYLLCEDTESIFHDDSYRVVMENMNDGLVVHEASGRIVRFNNSALRILDLSEDQLLGKTSMDPQWGAISEDGSDFPGERHPAVVALKTGMQVANVLMGVKAYAKKVRWIQITATPFVGQKCAAAPLEGVPQNLNVIVTFTDVTDLIEAKELLNRHFSVSPDMIFVGNSNLEFSSINPSFAKVLKFKEDEIIGSEFLKFVHPIEYTQTRKELKKLDEGTAAVEFSNRVSTSEGDWREVSWLLKKDKRNDQVFGIGRDVTESRKLEYGFRQLVLALEESAFVVSLDLKGRVISCKDNFTELLGLSPYDIQGESMELVRMDIHGEQAYKSFWEHMRGQKVWSSDLSFPVKANSVVWLRTVVAPIYNKDRVVESYLAIHFDITSEKKVEIENISLKIGIEQALKQAQESQLALQTVHENAPIGILEINTELRLISVNPGMLNLLGTNKRDLSFASLLDFVVEEDRSSAREFFSQVKSDLSMRRCSLRFQHNSGEIVNGVVVSKFVPAADKSEGRFYSVVENVTALVEAEKVLTQTREILDLERLKSVRNAKLASLGEMSAGIAHEINNPLTIITGNISIIEKFISDPEKLRSKLKVIDDSAARIARIVKGLKNFSRSSDTTEKNVFDLPGILRECVILTESKARLESTSVSLICDLTADVYCDEGEMEQVFVNLISNAIDATRGLEKRWVKVIVTSNGSQIIVQVQDSGQGIPEAVAAKIFQPFFTTKPVGKGTGLGLSIVKGILADHNATIELLANHPCTCFEVVIPIYSRAS
ncbi:MAG: PAS domain S-box protein [Pseudomonadota bacterium]